MANMRINPDGTPMAIDPMLWDQGSTQHPNNNDQFSYTSNQNNHANGQCFHNLSLHSSTDDWVPDFQPIGGYAPNPLPVAFPSAPLPIDYGTSTALQCLRARNSLFMATT